MALVVGTDVPRMTRCEEPCETSARHGGHWIGGFGRDVTSRKYMDD